MENVRISPRAIMELRKQEEKERNRAAHEKYLEERRQRAERIRKMVEDFKKENPRPTREDAVEFGLKVLWAEGL